MGADPLQERTPACLKPQSKPRICLILATTVAGCALIFSQMERAIFLRPFAEAQPPRAAQGAASALRTASDTPSSAPAVAARVVSADAPMPAKLRYSWVYLPRGDSRALLRSSMLDLRATNEYSGPIRLAQAVRPDHINGSLQPSQASCAHLCSYGESTACAVEASACDGVLSEDRRVCCAASCGRCGGAGCADLPGGRHSCCASRILSFASCCEENGAPCVVRTHRTLYLGEHSPHKRGRRRMRRPQPVTTPCKALNASAASPEAEAESVEARVQTHARSSGVRFLLATPSARVGSNWLRTMLEQHPQVFMEGEILSSTSYLRRGLEFPNNSVAAVDAAFESARLAALAQQKRVFGFKSGGPGMGLVCGTWQ
ncbi:hypothetical protein AB1Y20_018682 [Prymnesium parvum]|uniref:Uncharacterized protein n=1 Tax=Prymnesium parvum TaxID=97485 RepID=A0AB34JT16_PRYPA